jgi:large subunit ribosomal protein L9
MQVILTETLENLGEAGSIVNVKDGYARNFLFPRNLAAPATAGRKKHLEHLRRLADKKRLTEIRTAEDLQRRVESLEIEIEARSGEKDKLYGSVTTAQISEALAAQGVTIDRRKIVLDHPIRELGPHTVKVRIDPKVSASLRVNVLSSGEPEHDALFAAPVEELAPALPVDADDEEVEDDEA